MHFDRLHIQNVGNILDLTLSTYSIGYNEEDTGQYDSIYEPTFPAGACMIMRRSMIEQIGLFDPNYLFYHDDCDVGLRARLAGFKVMYVPSSIVYHKEGSTRSGYFNRNQLLYYSLNSRVGLFIKNLEFRSMLKIGIPFFLRNCLDIYAFLEHGDALLAIRSMLWILRNFKNDWKRRQIVQKKIRKISDGDLFEHFLDYSGFLLYLKMTRPLRWIVRPQDNLFKYVNCVSDVYYRDHKART